MKDSRYLRQKTCCKVDNEIYFLTESSSFSVGQIKGSQNLSSFISILHDMLFLMELRHDRRQVVFVQPGFLLPVGVRL